MSAPPPNPPRIDGYAYRQSIGSGGNSFVYLFQEDTPYREVAVKMPKKFGPDPDLRDSFKAEANAMARLPHEKPIVPVLAYREAVDGTPCLVMAYYKDGDLYAHVKALRQLPVAEVLTVGRQMADAVAAAHDVGLLHQDIKPANVLIATPGTSYRLGDFGIARQLRHGPGTYAFSPSWAAPEVVGGEDATERSDIYSLGATLWHLLSGSPPFVIPGGDNSPEALKQRTILGHPSPRVGREDAPDELTALLLRMMATDPSGRPDSVHEVLGELKRVRVEGIEDTILGPRRRTSPRRVVQDAVPPQPRIPTPVGPEAEEDRTVLKVRDDAVQAVQVSAPQSGYVYEAGGSAQGATVAARTVLRGAGAASETVQEQHSVAGDGVGAASTRRRGLLLSLGAIAVVIAGVVVAVFAGGGGARAGASVSSGTAAAAASVGDTPVEPGAPQGDGPPGSVTVAATRTDPATLRFTWTYSAAQASDTFRWRSADGKRTGTATASVLDLPDPAGTRLCIEIKVVRLDGSDGDPDWSPPGCGQ